MAIWRQLIVTSLLLLALLLLVSISHSSRDIGDGEVAYAAVLDGDFGHPCSFGHSCSPFVVALEARSSGDRPSSPAHLQGLPDPSYRSPHLTDDPPPPRRAL